MHIAVEIFSSLHLNILTLLRYDLEKQTKVVENIRTFVGRIAHRAQADLAIMHRTTELADM